MSIPDEYKDIVDMLAAATTEGRVKWVATKYDVQVAVSGSRFSLWTGNDANRKRDFVALALSDNDGKPLDAWQVDESSTEYDFMHDLYNRARRKALEVPQRLASIREEFKTRHIIGDTAPSGEKANIQS